MTQAITRPLWMGIALLLAAAAGALLIAPSNTSALSMSEYQRVLAGNGYTVSVGDKVEHATLSVDGVILTVTQLGKSAKVEFLDYGNQAALKADWIVENGKGPKPKTATSDFDGKVLYWNNDSVLVVDFGSSNDALIARAAANSYLGLPGSGGNQPSPTAAPGTATPAPGSPTATPGNFPPSGGPPADESDGNAWALGLALIAVAGLSATVLIARGQKTSS